MGDKALSKVLQLLPESMHSRQALNASEVEAAYSLVYRQYLYRGFCKVNIASMYFHSHCLLPWTRTFILDYSGIIAGTVTLIPDSPCGVPLEKALPQLAGGLRFKGKKIAEVSLLTLEGALFSLDGPLSPRHKLAASFQLFKTLLDYARHVAEITDLVIIVHPNHEPLYRNLAFTPAGPVLSYDRAGGNPGLPMWLDLVRLEKKLPETCVFRKFFFGDSLPIETLKKSWDRRSYLLGKLLDVKNMKWDGIFNGAVEYLKRRYPAPAGQLTDTHPKPMTAKELKKLLST